MTGRVEAIACTSVTIGGQTYDFGEGVRYVLEQSARDGCEVEYVANGGSVTQVMRCPKGATCEPRA